MPTGGSKEATKSQDVAEQQLASHRIPLFVVYGILTAVSRVSPPVALKVWVKGKVG